MINNYDDNSGIISYNGSYDRDGVAILMAMITIDGDSW